MVDVAVSEFRESRFEIICECECDKATTHQPYHRERERAE